MSMDQRAFIAAARFGYGARPGELGRIADDPRGWLLDQLRPGVPLPPQLASLPSGHDVIAEAMRFRGDPEGRKRFNRERVAPLFRDELARRTRAAAESDTPFRERLVRFWSNHFTVSALANRSRPVVGAFEREAIRPHVVGRFRDLLGAVVKHPAMLIYLDNVASVGPNSPRGFRSGRGLNENLAREIMELHTLGVDGGYTQADVAEFARILTGWSIADEKDATPGAFAYRYDLHEPGPKRLLGRIYDQGGQAEGEAALDMLARHPATARHIARKLAVHFVADDPPPAAVERLRRSFVEADGDLGALARALVDLPEIWQRPYTKVKSPDELTVSTWRLIGAPEKPGPLLAPLRLLGQIPFTAPSPAGWPDTAADWVAPEMMVHRIQLADLIARRAARRFDPRSLAIDALGPAASETTRRTIDRAPSPHEALALLLASPEFQRR
jgi:uncharacterized protein (DUF1800 family)